MTFDLSKFKINLLAENHIITWERNRFGTEQKSPKFMLEIMTLVSWANDIRSDIGYILSGKGYIYI